MPSNTNSAFYIHKKVRRISPETSPSDIFMDGYLIKTVQRLKAVNPLISEFAERMTYKDIDPETGKEQLYLKQYIPPAEDAGKISLYNMDPYDYENLISAFSKTAFSALYSAFFWAPLLTCFFLT